MVLLTHGDSVDKVAKEFKIIAQSGKLIAGTETKQMEGIIFTVRKWSLRRLCFYTCLSVILFTGRGMSRPRSGLGRGWGVSPGGCPGPGPWGCIPACTEADTPPSRRLLLRMVHILLECILVHSENLTSLWLISAAGLGFRFRLWLKTLWLHSIMQNMFPLTQTQIQIPFPNRYCSHFRDGSLSQV